MDPVTAVVGLFVVQFLGWVVTVWLYQKYTRDRNVTGMSIITFFLWPIGLGVIVAMRLLMMAVSPRRKAPKTRSA